MKIGFERLERALPGFPDNFGAQFALALGGGVRLGGQQLGVDIGCFAAANRRAGPDATAARQAATLFRVLASPTRLAILLTLQTGEQRITDLAAQLGGSQASISG